MDRRVWTALLLMLAGSTLLVLDQSTGAGGGLPWGLLAVAIATAAWGIDNSLSRALAERDPSQVVLVKAMMGVAAVSALAILSSESLPAPLPAAALLLIGATSYGLSLRFYLLAQRAFGAARTGSVFAFAPFVGAVIAVIMGDRSFGALLLAGSLLMLAGVLLHLMESHDHAHTHEVLEHEHAHRHDDAHHDHGHDPMPSGEHSHWHRHEPLRHAHPHVPDAHHRHGH
jgi:drug/metabolite transporter (DMT)-like permease